MWDLPRPGIEPVFPALAGGFLTIAPPGKSLFLIFFKKIKDQALAFLLNLILLAVAIVPRYYIFLESDSIVQYIFYFLQHTPFENLIIMHLIFSSKYWQNLWAGQNYRNRILWHFVETFFQINGDILICILKIQSVRFCFSILPENYHRHFDKCLDGAVWYLWVLFTTINLMEI